MTSRNPDNRDLSRACWRCTHSGDIVAEAHASCRRDSGVLQAWQATHPGIVDFRQA